MAPHNLNALLCYLRQLVRSTNDSGASDAELLERYVRRRDETAFELLLWRHGALVFNVCRCLLPSEQDAEDAFQATFLTFVRKAGSISRRGSVAAWLYKVAYRVALEAMERMRKTAAVEKAGGEAQTVASADDPLWSDVRPILDEELNRLPEHLRRPIVLCYLEGKSNAEAARELGCRLGTIYSRLSRGRELLRQRFQHRGMTLPAAALAAVLTARAAEAAPTISLVRAAARAALDFADPSAAANVSPRVAALAEGVMRTMFVTKLKIAAVILLVIGVAAGGVWTQARTADPQTEAKAENPPSKPEGGDKKNAEPVRVKVVKPKPGGLKLKAIQRADVVAAHQQQIVPLVSGTIKEVRVELGDRVKKGQVLIVLDAPLLVKEVEEAAANLEMAQAQVDEAKATLEAAEKLAHKGLGEVPQKARASLRAASAKAKLAQAALDKARIQESHTRLTAAFDGVVTRRTADPGNFVQLSDSRLLTPLLTVQSFDPLRLVVQLNAEYALRISRGDPGELVLSKLNSRIGGLKVTRFNSALDGVEGTMRVEMDVPNPDGRLLPGMVGQVTIHFHKVPAGTMVVPSSCLLTGQSVVSNTVVLGASVYVVRDRKAYLTPVTPGHIGADEAEIVQGIKESDLIVTEPPGEPGQEVREVVPVKIEKAP